jgi:hypothetical protein
LIPTLIPVTEREKKGIIIKGYMQANKTCTKCFQIKTVDNFYINKLIKSGLQSWCKICTSQSSNDFRKRYPDRKKAINKKYVVSHSEEKSLYDKKWKTEINPQRAIYSNYKVGATSRKILWDITFEQFMIFWQKPCDYCKDPIKTIGLDRVNSRLGYVIDNLVPCCYPCNRMKSNLTRDQFKSHISKIYQNGEKNAR